MRNFACHIILALGMAMLFAASCRRDNVPEGPAVPPGQPLGQITITDEFVSIDTKADPETFKYLDHKSTRFNTGDIIQICIDYEFQPDLSLSSAAVNGPSAVGEKLQYVHNIPFTKQDNGLFTSPYDVLWLSDYAFDVYGVYPYDVATIDVEGSSQIDLDDNLTYHRIPVTYKSMVKVPNTAPDNYVFGEGIARAGTVPQYYEDALDDKNYVCTGASIFREKTIKNGDEEYYQLAADPHDLITSINEPKKTIGTKYPDHEGNDIRMHFKHMLSRLQLKFVNGLGENPQVYLRGIAIYPDVIEAKYALKRDRWVERKKEKLFEYRDGKGWLHRPDTTSAWSDNPITDYNTSTDKSQWDDFYNNAPVLYKMKTPFHLNSIEPVPAVDTVEGTDYIVEFRMIPNSTIDFMILHFDVEGTDAYLPVRLKSEFSDGQSLKFREGHLTQLMLSYQATMITLLYVKVLKDWTELDNRYVTGDLTII